MKSFRTIIPVFGVIAALAGCSAGGANSGVDPNGVQKNAVSNTQLASDKGSRPHAGPPRGPDFLVFAALHENINLTPEQKSTIEGLVAANRPKDPPQPDKARVTALAAAIRAGKVESSNVQMVHVDMESAMKERQAKLASTLTTLHDTLTKDQRAALVDAVVARHAKGPGREGTEGHHAGPAFEGHDRQGPRGPMGGLLQGLDLTQAQKDDLKTKLDALRPSDADREAMKTKFETMKKDMEAKLQTFKNDTFDATAFVTPPAGMDHGGPQGHAGMAKELSIIVSVLTPAQRETLAQKIEQGPPARPQVGPFVRPQIAPVGQ